ncbi:MAG: ribonuclease P protein component [Chitinophagaceae bacterium]
MPATHTLGKLERLKRRKVIDQLFSEGKAFTVFPIRVQYFFTELPDAVPLQAGFTASSRYFKKAVDRNRIKRLMREAYRLQKNVLQESLLQKQKQLGLFFIYTGKELPDYTLVSGKITVILKRITQVVNEGAVKNT